jgi:hypothetical protein
MEIVFDDKYKDYSVSILNKYYNNNTFAKINYINQCNNISDEEILKILECNYKIYGLVTKNMISEKDRKEIQFSKFLTSQTKLIDKFRLILLPEEIFNKVNKLINITNKIIDILVNNYEKFKNYDERIVILLYNLRQTDLKLYIESFVNLNNIRLFINLLFFEYLQDVTYISNQLFKIKYDSFITYDNIEQLNLETNSILGLYNPNKEFVLKTNSNIINFKFENGNIELELLENYILQQI